MKWAGLTKGLLFCAAFVPGLSARASDVTLIVDMTEFYAAYYISLPAQQIKEILGTNPDLLFSDNGSVPIDDFRLNGSFELGDEVFERVQGSIAGQPIPLETMSMMVHPTDDPAPFQTPWDAVTATAVCIVDYAEDQLTPEYLQLYYGSYAHKVDATSGVDLTFPKTGREPVNVTMHLYWDGDYVARELVVLEDGGTVTAKVTGSSSFAVLWWAAAVLWVLAIGAAVFAMRLRAHRAEVVVTN